MRPPKLLSSLSLNVTSLKLSQDRLEYLTSSVSRISLQYTPSEGTLLIRGSFDGTYFYAQNTQQVSLQNIEEYVHSGLQQAAEMHQQGKTEQALSSYLCLKNILLVDSCLTQHLKAANPHCRQLERSVVTLYDHLGSLLARVGLPAQAQEYSDLACNYLRVYMDEFKFRNGGQNAAHHSTAVTLVRGQQQLLLARLVLKNSLFLSDLGRHAEVANTISEVGCLVYSCVLKMAIVSVRSMVSTLKSRASRLTRLYLKQDDYMLTREDYATALKELDGRELGRKTGKSGEATLLDELTRAGGKKGPGRRQSSGGLDISGISEEDKTDRFGNHYTQKEQQDMKLAKHSSAVQWVVARLVPFVCRCYY